MKGKHRYLRFGVPERIEHWVLTLSFTTLAITGLVQKYSSGWYPQQLIGLLGGIESVRIIHRVAAIVMMLETVYHIGVVGYRVFVRRTRLTMLPGMADVHAAIHALMNNLGLRESRPKEDRFTFAEKAEYWALVWGTIVMTVTGFVLWNPVASARILPGEFIPAAKAAHGGEAVLAGLAIIVWHFYGVHVKYLNKSMFDGHLTEHEMVEEHPLELATLKAGVADRPVDAKQFDQRRRRFSVIYGASAVIALVAIYYFVTFEASAIATVPPAEDVVVYAPLTPTPLPTSLPTPTPRPTATPLPTLEARAELGWQDGPATIFEEACGACHNSATALGNLDLSSYEGALAGSSSGSVIEPGDPDASRLVVLLEGGEHPGQVSGDELERIREWIEGGALGEPATEPEGSISVPETAVGWQELAGLFEQKCVSCHSDALAMGGLDLSSHEAALTGGNSGPVIQAGDPDASGLVILQAQGGHPGQLSEDELERVRQWIEHGGLEE